MVKSDQHVIKPRRGGRDFTHLRLIIFIFPSKYTGDILRYVHLGLAFALVDIIRNGFGYFIQIVFTHQKCMTHQLRQQVMFVEPFGRANFRMKNLLPISFTGPIIKVNHMVKISISSGRYDFRT